MCNMKTRILIKKINEKLWCADRPQMCGSPTVGYGKTEIEALGDLIWQDQNSFNVSVKIEVKNEN